MPLFKCRHFGTSHQNDGQWGLSPLTASDDAILVASSPVGNALTASRRIHSAWTLALRISSAAQRSTAAHTSGSIRNGYCFLAVASTSASDWFQQDKKRASLPSPGPSQTALIPYAAPCRALQTWAYENGRGHFLRKSASWSQVSRLTSLCARAVESVSAGLENPARRWVIQNMPTFSRNVRGNRARLRKGSLGAAQRLEWRSRRRSCRRMGAPKHPSSPNPAKPKRGPKAPLPA